MKPEKSALLRNRIKIPLAMFAVALLLLLCVLWQTRHHPRTDDASVRANYVLFAPEVTGRILRIPVRDNAFVHAGDVLFAIAPRP